MYLYAISSDSRYIKFGVAGRPIKRLIELQIGSPQDLKLLGEIFAYDSEPAFELERIVHRALEAYHVRGEWFQMVPKTLALVDLMNTRRYAEFRSLVLGWCTTNVADWHAVTDAAIDLRDMEAEERGRASGASGKYAAIIADMKARNA
jgi:Meiotically up-regulated gene 113